MIKTLYIAGAFTAPTVEGVRANISIARAIGHEVAKLGVMPFIPHTNTDETFLGIQGAQFWYNGTLRLLEAADGILMLLGWANSKGAIDEQRRAIQLRKENFYVGDPNWPTQVRDWGQAVSLP